MWFSSSIDTHEIALFWLSIWAITVSVTLKIANPLFVRHSSSWWPITMPGLLAKGSAVQKTSFGRTLIELSTYAVTLTLNTAIQSFCKTIRLKLMYRQTNVAVKTISSSEDNIVETVRYEPSLWPWPWRLASKSFLHDTPAREYSPPFHVWSQKVERFRRYYPDKQTDMWFQYFSPPSPRPSLGWVCVCNYPMPFTEL